ncbi:MAG TPA: DUF488 family protein [Rhodanobacteraceae bacterium]|nr:DUF488 family protein [Rhodanobacteraceae bacterium]
MDISIKRVYESAAKADGYRVLVDHIWPRGVSKERAAIDLWAKAISPSTALRQWFDHQPARWPEFKRRYHAELVANDEAQAVLSALRAHKGPVTLVFAARDAEHSNARYLQEQLSSK